jgi:hypothetical protein
MNKYIFYTPEGNTQAPLETIIVNNCQVLGWAFGESAKDAKCNLLKENPWIEEAGYDFAKIKSEQILIH